MTASSQVDFWKMLLTNVITIILISAVPITINIVFM